MPEWGEIDRCPTGRMCTTSVLLAADDDQSVKLKIPSRTQALKRELGWNREGCTSRSWKTPWESIKATTTNLTWRKMGDAFEAGECWIKCRVQKACLGIRRVDLRKMIERTTHKSKDHSFALSRDWLLEQATPRLSTQKSSPSQLFSWSYSYWLLYRQQRMYLVGRAEVFDEERGRFSLRLHQFHFSFSFDNEQTSVSKSISIVDFNSIESTFLAC